MALQRQNIAIPFATRVDQKSDPLQESASELSSLVNAVYNKDRRIDKRSGFAPLTQLPESTDPTTITTFMGNLTVIGSSLQAYVESNQSWINKGRFQPVELSVLSAQKNSKSQSSQDVAYSDTGLACVTYLDSDGIWRYQISDSNNGQVLVAPVEPESGAVNLRASVIGGYFLVTYTVVVLAVPRIRYVAVPLANIDSPLAPGEISNLVASGTSLHDVYVQDAGVIIAWESTANSVRVTCIDPVLNISPATVVAGTAADRIAVTVDETASKIWVVAHDAGANETRAFALNPNLSISLALTTYDTGPTVNNLTAVAQNGSVEIFRQIENTYSFSATRTDYVDRGSITQAGSVTAPSVITRNMGLGGKAFLVNSLVYVLGATQSDFQDTYFLLDGQGNPVARLAYSNGGGYELNGILAKFDVDENIARSAYLIKDSLVPVNKNVNPDAPGGIFTGTGVNLVRFDLNKRNLSTAEIGKNLHIAGGLLWAYDGTTLTEQGFNNFPEDAQVTDLGSATGSMAAQQYFYQVTYEWTDEQGNVHRSAPSVPLSYNPAGADSSVQIDIPTLRLTYKPDVRIVIYRWSAAQQAFYQITSITSPLLNDPTVDSVQYVDTVADADILGNPLIYTTGGVVENTPGPATSSISLYQSRLVLISSENKNVVLYSKQVLQSTPVEMSDLFTVFVSPTIGAQGSTGDTEVLYPMDEKLLFFKQNAIYFLIGAGPDATGANNDFVDPTFITSAVGSSNQDSMITIPQGVLFQSDKGIWLLSRELSTIHLGAPVEDFALNNTVTSAQIIPTTTQARMTLTGGTAVMYDYFFDRWSTFDQIPAISSTLFEAKHTYITENGEVRQERAGYYKDGPSSPVKLKFETPWYNLAGLQGFQRASMFYLLGTFKSAHRLRVLISYDYEDSPTQQIIMEPSQANKFFGDNPFYGQGQVHGDQGSLEQYRVFLNRQKMQAFKVSIEELPDTTGGQQAGEGLTLSGLNLVVALKKGYTPIKATRSFG